MNRVMGRFGLWIGFLFLWVGCDPKGIKMEGDIVDLQGEIQLLTVLPSSLDTLKVAGQRTGTKVEWEIASLDIPAKVWVEADGKRVADFILDERKGMRLDGAINMDSVVVSGGKLEREYRLLRQFLDEKYHQPLEEIDQSISRMVSRRNRTSSDEKRLKRLVTLKGHYERYRDAYIKKLIRANLSHELSLVLIEEELRDSVEVQKQLFHELKIENKNSNLYRILEKRLQ